MPKRKIFEGERKYRVVGYRDYENTWPALRHTGIGIIFVYDGDISSEELENWQNNFLGICRDSID